MFAAIQLEGRVTPSKRCAVREVPYSDIIAVPYAGLILLIGCRGIAVVEIDHGIARRSERRDL